VERVNESPLAISGHGPSPSAVKMSWMPRLAALPALAGVALAACGTPSSSSRPRPSPAPAAAPAVAAPAPPAPPPPEVIVAQARALRLQGDLAGARAELETALRTAPDSDDVRLELADLLVSEARDSALAWALLKGVRSRDGARWSVVSGRLGELVGDDPWAVDAYARALAAADDPDVRLRRALALERLGRADEATEELERVRASRPDDALVSARLGECYEAAGRLREAEAELRASAEAQPERAAGWQRLALFYERRGRPAEASAALARARDAGGRGGRSLRPLLPSGR
jgi:tetratricopeptide (TPR) repeat protein